MIILMGYIHLNPSDVSEFLADVQAITPSTKAEDGCLFYTVTLHATLRPYGLGSTQWYVLWHLANSGPVVQRDLGRSLELERPTLSGIIATLVRKVLIQQTRREQTSVSVF